MYQYFDKKLILLWLLLLLFGVAMQLSIDAEFGATRHLQHVGIALLVAAGGAAVPTARWQKLSKVGLGAAFVLAVLVLIPGIGREALGARRWIPLPILSVHVSMLVSWLFLVYLAGHVARQRQELRGKYLTASRVFMTLILAMLLLAQPDTGTTFLLMLTGMTVLFISGAPLWAFAATSIVLVLGVALLFITASYRVARLMAFADPWSHAFDRGFQLTQSLIAFGAGELTGLGYGEGVQKLGYLPDAKGDFVLAIVAEEFGGLGAIALLCLIGLLAWRIWVLANRSAAVGNWFAATLAKGFAVFMVCASLLNAAGITGLLPRAGLSLPFISAGGNHIVVYSAMIAMVARIEFDRRAGVREGGRLGALSGRVRIPT
jgi:cell division protein FtsW